MGELYPRLARLPGYREVADSPVTDYFPERGGAPVMAKAIARPLVEPAVRDAVLGCPSRGSVLPLSMQREGCRACELTECKDGRGTFPGRVTLLDCISCQTDRLQPART
jgi:hypothetical protein